jgi:hypothetical protein
MCGERRGSAVWSVEELLDLLVLRRVVPIGALERCRSHVGWLLLDRMGELCSFGRL